MNTSRFHINCRAGRSYLSIQLTHKHAHTYAGQGNTLFKYLLGFIIYYQTLQRSRNISMLSLESLELSYPSMSEMWQKVIVQYHQVHQQQTLKTDRNVLAAILLVYLIFIHLIIALSLTCKANSYSLLECAVVMMEQSRDRKQQQAAELANLISCKHTRTTTYTHTQTHALLLLFDIRCVKSSFCPAIIETKVFQFNEFVCLSSVRA